MDGRSSTTTRPQTKLKVVINRADGFAYFSKLEHNFHVIVVARVSFERLEVIVSRYLDHVPRPSRMHDVFADFKRSDDIDLVRERTQLIDYLPASIGACFGFEFEEHDVFYHGR